MMKSKLKKLGGTARQLEVVLTSEEVSTVLNETLEGIRKNAKINGFREGKAPLDIIRKKYEKEALDEAKKRLIPDAYQQALAEHDLSTVSYPEVSDISLDPSVGMTFVAKVDIFPEIKLRKYKGLKVIGRKMDVSDKEVEEALGHMRNIHAEYTEKDSSIEKGDFGICDVEAFVAGVSISKKHMNMWIEADKESSLLGLGEELCGMKKGDGKDIDVKLPENYPDKKYAGKDATFNVEVKEVRQKKLPEVGEDLAKKMEKSNMDEVRGEIRDQLKRKKEHHEKVNMMNQIMEQLLKNHDFAAPESMVKRQLAVLVERAGNELAQKGVAPENIESEKSKLEQSLRADAENKVKLYFILVRIADEEKISVGEEEIENWLRSLAGAYGQKFEDVKKYYEEKDLIDGLREQLREEKTLDFLLSEAAVTEKD